MRLSALVSCQVCCYVIADYYIKLQLLPTLIFLNELCIISYTFYSAYDKSPAPVETTTTLQDLTSVPPSVLDNLDMSSPNHDTTTQPSINTDPVTEPGLLPAQDYYQQLLDIAQGYAYMCILNY